MSIVHWFTASWLHGIFTSKDGFVNSPYFIVAACAGFLVAAAGITIKSQLRSN